MMRSTILAVSACFLLETRYDGQQAIHPEIERLLTFLREQGIFLLPLCPEQLGGLSTPRPPAEIQGNLVKNTQGDDVTAAFYKGAAQSLALLQHQQVTVALLKQKSPSCGHGVVYDGSFQRRLISGNGITTSLLLKNNIAVYTEDDVKDVSWVARHLAVDEKKLQAYRK